MIPEAMRYMILAHAKSSCGRLYILKVTPSKERENQLSGFPVPNISRKAFLWSAEAAVAMVQFFGFHCFRTDLKCHPASPGHEQRSKWKKNMLVLYKLQLLID